MTTFKARLKSRDFVVSLVKIPPKTMVEMLMKAQKYINVEDALATIKDVEKSGDKGRNGTIVEDKKGSVQTDGSMMGVKGKMRKLLKR